MKNSKIYIFPSLTFQTIFCVDNIEVQIRQIGIILYINCMDNLKILQDIKDLKVVFFHVEKGIEEPILFLQH